MAFWQHFVERLPGTLGLKPGHGFSLGNTASLPACDERRRGEMWRVQGDTGVADRVVICTKDSADAYDWEDFTTA